MPKLPEAIAYWYFRLNGFLTNVNFLVHPEAQRDSSTDVDILGVRFPFRSENITRPMKDDEIFTRHNNCPYVVFAEVTIGRCKLNGPWLNPDARNMDKVLRAVGTFKINRNSIVAKSLYREGVFESKSFIVLLFCIGRETNPELTEKYPRVPQITYEQALHFIYKRLNSYYREKVQHHQWDSSGHWLWNCSRQSKDSKSFCARVKSEAGIRGLTTG